MKQLLLSSLLAASALSASAAYDINYPSDTKITNDSRHLTSFTITVDGMPAQTLNVGQAVKGKLYFDLTDKCFIATPGKPVSIDYDYAGAWMNSYVYLDRENDGEFNVDSDNPLSPSDDLLAFSNYQNSNSAGTTLSSGNNIKTPVFEIPADLIPGTYRLRVKIDWNSIDPGGNTKEGNTITANGGAIVDVTLLITTADCSLAVLADNGTVTLADGSDANGASVPASGTLDFLISPAEGYMFDGLSITGGYDVPTGITPVNPALAQSEVHFTALSLTPENILPVPVEHLAGHTVIEASFLPAEGSATEGEYTSPYSGAKSAAQGFTQLTINSSTSAVESTTLHTPASLMFNSEIGAPLSVSALFDGQASKFNFSIDYNHDGTFNSNSAALSCERLASAQSPEFATLTLPAELRPGVYRARLEAEGHSSADFFINLHKANVDVNVLALNSIALKTDGTPLALTAPALTSLRVRTSPTLPGYEPVKAIVRHGQNLSGPEFICGNPQWADYEATILNSGSINVPASVVNGDLTLYVIYQESESSEWTKVWADEFNSGQFDPERWQWQERLSPTWKRFVAQTDRGHQLVNTFENGCYNAHCFATPADLLEAEGSPMISGAIMSQHRFDVKYGKIEARLKTTPHSGNFPAFWMLPTYSEIADLGLNGWPRDGEIDIWEQINAENRSYHTIHSGWTKWSNTWTEAPKQNSPTSSGNVACDATLWHVFALEWDAEELRWFVDGKQVFSYKNQHYSEPGSDKYFEKITWPFDKHFYIILNQSVGDGSWAANVDQSFHYLTLFDYVRVYQKKSEIDNLNQSGNNGDDPDFYIPAKGLDETESSIVDLTAEPDPDASATTLYFDLNGRRVLPSALLPGIYIAKSPTHTTKILIP